MHTLLTTVLTLLASTSPIIRHLPTPQDPPAGVEAIVNQIATQALEEAQAARPDSLSDEWCNGEIIFCGVAISSTPRYMPAVCSKSVETGRISLRSPLDTMTFTDPSVYDSLLTQWQEQSSVAAFETFISEFKPKMTHRKEAA